MSEMLAESRSFQAPFVMKTSFYSPTDKNASKNAAHVAYIATRPGAVLETEGLTSEYEIDYSELETENSSEAAIHVKYIDERPGSYGLFSSLDNPYPNMKDIQKEIMNHKGVVWRNILSLTEGDAKRLSLDNRKSWEDTLRAAVPEAAMKMGIAESNLRWVAAFHQEQGHPHVHLMIWEKEPKRSKGLLSKGERIDVRKVFMKHVYAEEQTRLYQERTAMRDLIRDFAKKDTDKAVELHKEVLQQEKNVRLMLESAGELPVGIAPKPFAEDLKHVTNQLKELSLLMPLKGRAALKLLPESAKEKAREIAEGMMKQPAFYDSYQRYMKATEEITRLQTSNPDVIQKAKDNAHADLRDRVANVLVKGAATLNKVNVSSIAEARKDTQFIKQQTTRVSNSVWRSLWKAIEGIKIQSEAQSEYAKRRLLRRERQKQRQQNNEHER